MCSYTVLLGGYEDLLEQPIAAESDINFVCFVDDSEIRSGTWQLRVIEPAFPTDSGRSSRFPKISAHRVLPEYDVSLYIDNSVLLRAKPEVIIEELLAEDASFVSIAHSFRDTVEEEFEAVVDSGFDASWVCAEQLAHYRIVDPASLLLRPVWSGLMIRRHNEPRVATAMDCWWSHVLRYSRRDQLSYWMAMRQTPFDPTLVELDNYMSRYHEWPRSTGRQRDRAGALPTNHELERLREDLIRLSEVEASCQDLLRGERANADQLRHQLTLAMERVSELEKRIADLEASTS